MPPIASTKPKQRQGNPSTLHRAPARLALQANRFPRPAVYIYTRRGQDGRPATGDRRPSTNSGFVAIRAKVAAPGFVDLRGPPCGCGMARSGVDPRGSSWPPLRLRASQLRGSSWPPLRLRASQLADVEAATVMNLSWVGIPLLVLKVVEFAPTAIVLVPRALRRDPAIRAAYEEAVLMAELPDLESPSESE